MDLRGYMRSIIRVDVFDEIVKGRLIKEIYDPFIWLLNPLGFVFIVCGWIELRAKKKIMQRRKSNK